MRLVPNIDTVPARVNKYLLPHERNLVATRRHPAMLIPSAATATGGLLSALAVNPVVKGNRPLELTTWLLMGFLLVQFILACISWSTKYFIVTSQRLILTTGMFSITRVTTLPLETAKNIIFNRSRAGRLFGYGTFIFGTGSRIDYIPYSEQISLEIHGLVFKDQDSPLD